MRRQLAVQMLQLTRRCVAANDWPRLDSDLDNVRAVLGWCVDRAELAVGARLLWALQIYLFWHGGSKEQAEWHRRLLALPEAAQPGISRARLLVRVPADSLSDMEADQIVTELTEAIGLSRELGDQTCLARALELLAYLRLH